MFTWKFVNAICDGDYLIGYNDFKRKIITGCIKKTTN